MSQIPSGPNQGFNRRILTAAVPDQWWDRLKGAQYGFIAGIFIGLIFGWFFHGVISMAVRFGMLLLLLLPLLVIGWLWFRSQRQRVVIQAQPVVTVPEAEWRSVVSGSDPYAPRRPEPDSTLVDVPLVRTREGARPVDIEAELDALKSQREQNR